MAACTWEGCSVDIFYEGKNITEMVQTRECTVRDCSGPRCDSLELEFENAAGWYSWGPEEDDRILASHNGYNTGIMYVNTILPEDGKYRILASALPCRARLRENRSFATKSIEEIMRTCAMASGMDFALYGIDGQAVLPYVEQNDEWCAAFLYRLLSLEGAVLKCVNGKYTAIGISYAQGIQVSRTLNVSAQQEGLQYIRSGMSCRSVTVRSPYAAATAEDLAVPQQHARITVGGLPVMNDAQAGRWARGKLMCLNRSCESVYLQSDFDPGYTAMSRVDICGGTDADGEWIVEEVTHDFVNLKTDVRMCRCIQTIQ